MINAEKLLGGLIRQSLSGRRGRRRSRRKGLGSLLGSGMGTVAGLGAIGLAIAAFDHFVNKNKTPATSTGTPPVPPAASSAQRPASPPPPPPSGKPYEDQQTDPFLLIQAMLAAANADGNIDESERQTILHRLEEAGMTPEEQHFIQAQLSSPPNIDDLVPRITTPALAQQIYLVSLLAIRVDTQAERDYLSNLGAKLQLTEERMRDLEAGVMGEENIT